MIMDFLRKHMRTIFVITILTFFAGIFIGFGGYFFSDAATADIAAEVNGKNISYRAYSSHFNRTIENVRQSGTEVTEDIIRQKKQEALQDLIQEEVFWQEAKKYGIVVTDAELAADIRNYPAFQQNGNFDQRAYFQVLRQMLRMTPAEFEESRRRQLAVSKLRNLIASSVKVSEAELRDEYARANKGKTQGFEKEREKFLESVRQQKIMMVFSEWYKGLNQTVKIKVHLNERELQS